MKGSHLIIAVLFAGTTPAATATDRSDLWWNQAESGWGMTIANQGDILFITLYAYGSDGQPTWFVGPSTTFQAADSQAQGINVFSGPWYRVTGPYFGGAFNPSSVNATQVGTVTYRALSVTTGQVIYVVNGVSVTKNVQRQTFQNNPNVYGSFLGGYVSDIVNCSFSGHQEYFVYFTISGTTSATVATMVSPATTCTLRGPYTQAGRMGSIQASFSCTNGISGTGSIFEIEAATAVISGRFTLSYSGCTESGHFGGTRR